MPLRGVSHVRVGKKERLRIKKLGRQLDQVSAHTIQNSQSGFSLSVEPVGSGAALSTGSF